MTSLLVLAIGFGVVSCDASRSFSGKPVSDQPPVLPDQSPAGIYTGMFKSLAIDPSPNRMVAGAVDEDNRLHLMIQDGLSQYGGVVSVGGDKLTGTLTEYLGARARFFGFDGVRSITLDGTVTERDRLFGDYSGDDEGFFGLDYVDTYENATSLDQTTGVWSFNLSSSGGAVYSITLDIDPDGLIFGTDTNGCVFSGSLGIIDARYGVYSSIVTLSMCDALNGEYDGLAYLGNLGLNLFFANDSYAFSTILSQ